MLGVLMLDTVFPRVAGDIGNPATFGFPVRYTVVKGSFPRRVIYEPDSDLLSLFIQAARRLEQEGSGIISTSCGFLAIFQKQIAESIGVPFISSSLLQVPMVRRMLPAGKKVGIMTAESSRLTEEHFAGVGAEGVPVVIHGMEGEEEFRRVFINNSPDADMPRLEREVRRVAARFAREDVGAIVLECTNLPPFEPLIREAAGLPVFHLNGLISMCCQSLGQPSPVISNY